jgi:Glycosyltransferase family 87
VYGPGSVSPASRSWKIAWAGACVAIFLGSWSLLHHLWYLRLARAGDAPIYQAYAHKIVDGQMPYRDFSIEYPPGFLLPALAPETTAAPVGFESYDQAFDRWMAGAGVVLILLTALALSGLGAGREHFTVALGFIAISPLLLGGLMPTHFDLWVTALAIGGLAALIVGRNRPAGVLLGAAIATKVWPAVLVPLGLVWIWRRLGRAAAIRWLLLVAAVCAVFFVPFAVLAPTGLGHSFGLQIDRPLQLESLGAALLLAAHNLGGLTVSVTTGYGSRNIAAPGATVAMAASTLVALVGLCVVWTAFARGPARADRLATAAAASIAVFITFGKVFSPQYLIWLIPFVPLARSRLASLLLGAALVLTQFYFPIHYGALADLQPWPAWLILVRDLTVAALAVELGRVLLERDPIEDTAPLATRGTHPPEALLTFES